MDIKIENAYYSYSAFTMLILIGIAGIALIIWSFIRLYRHFHPQNKESRWKKVTAYTTGVTNTVLPNVSSKYHIQKEIEVYEVEYFVEGHRYTKFAEFVPFKDKGTEVEIWIDVKHPSRMREHKEVHTTQNWGIANWGITLMGFFFGVLMVMLPIRTLLGW